MGPVARPRVQLFNNGNNVGYAHSLSICSRLSGIAPRNQTIYVAGYCNFVIIEFVHGQQKVNFAIYPLGRVNETAMVNYLSVFHNGLNLCFHFVFGVDCVCHNDFGLWPGLPRAGVSHLSDANIFFEKQIGHSFGHFVFALNIFVECSLINAHRIIFNNNGDFVKVGVKSFFCDVLFHCRNLYREPARAVGFIIEPGYKYSAFFLKPKIFS